MELLAAQAAAWGVGLGGGRRERLLEYARMLHSYDRANVIGTRDLEGILLSHVLDSLSCFLFKPLFRKTRLADVGSGGGLPGIPLHIARPELAATLIESTGKKANFLEYAVDRLALEGVRVANSRVEELGREGEHRGAYDVVTCRAVSRLSVVAEYCVPLLEVGGTAIAMKGGLVGGEISEGRRAAAELGARVDKIERVPLLPELGERERNLVIIRKTRQTPAAYPRRAGAVVKKPLGS